MSRYADARPYMIPASLSQLHGPKAGAVRLPRHLDWGPDYLYDLADPADVAVMYERVIREAQSAADLADHLDSGTLRRLWALLILPPQIRTGWEARFPELARTVAAA